VLGSAVPSRAVAARVTDGDMNQVEYLFHGVLGSLLVATNASGEGTARYGYGAFGEVLYAEGANALEYDRRYNGKPHDEVSGLRYYGARYYDPLTLSWTQADPLYRFVPEAGLTEPRRMGLYTFCLNNPVRYVDPDGRTKRKEDRDRVGGVGSQWVVQSWRRRDAVTVKRERSNQHFD
jgi:RHS repeat-associated protein